MSRKLKKEVIQTEARYIRDGGRPSGGALQRGPPNHRTLLRLRAAVVNSVSRKRRTTSSSGVSQEGERK